MGPRSKEAVCAVLGHILDEQQQQRSTLTHELGEIKSMLQSVLESEKAELVQVNKRVTALEKAFGGFGGPAPTPA